MKLSGFQVWLKHRGMKVLVWAVMGAALLQVGVTLWSQDHEDRGRAGQLTELTRLNNEQTEQITTQTTEILKLQRLSQEQQALIICLLQLHTTEGTFTERDECQARVNEAREQSSLLFEGRNDPAGMPNPRTAPQPNPQPQPPQQNPGLLQRTIGDLEELLGV